MPAKTPFYPDSGCKISRRKFLGTGSAFTLLILIPGCAPRRDFDLLITNGLVCDGTSREPLHADIGVKKGKIVAVDALKDKYSARRVIDAEGHMVVPGFIDIHSHSDDDLLVDGRAHSKIRQGVTTEVIGQDGSSYAPLTPEMRQKLHERLQKAYGVSVDWQDFKGYFRRLHKQGISVNLMSMVGAGTLRENVVGTENRPATPKEIQAMQRLLQQSLQQGARHLSSGLEYTPGSFASTEELIQLASVLGAGGVYSTHMRNEDDRVLQAVAEAVQIARGGNCALNVSHLKASGKRNWKKLDAILNILDEARQGGLHVTCDRYPYLAYSTGLTSLFPLWSREGDSEQFVQRLQNPDLIGRIKQAVEAKIQMLGTWDAVMISSMQEEAHKAYTGRRLGELAREKGQDPFEFLRQLMIAEKGHGGMVGFAMSEENTAKVLAYPYCAIASDGSARATEGPLSEGHPHPRNFGTFPRVLRYYVREKRILTMADAIRKMTSLPADIVGLRDRGRLTPGYQADIVIFNPETVADRATFTQPKQYPVGIDYVLVNGRVVIDQGEHTNALPGKIL